jgi:hypothetical protein
MRYSLGFLQVAKGEAVLVARNNRRPARFGAVFVVVASLRFDVEPEARQPQVIPPLVFANVPIKFGRRSVAWIPTERRGALFVTALATVVAVENW